ncbi:MAG: DUF5615 family PIN-like protein [Acidobacteriota bacterium]|nr:DUF5615 family PIN-like protein [Acidobacteriota bacterium]
MKFKIDENLPADFASRLISAGHNAETVHAEMLTGAEDELPFDRCQAEERILITLDLDFSNVQSYPPSLHVGVVIFRAGSQDKRTLHQLLNRFIQPLNTKSPRRQLGIVGSDRVRFRE